MNVTKARKNFINGRDAGIDNAGTYMLRRRVQKSGRRFAHEQVRAIRVRKRGAGPPFRGMDKLQAKARRGRYKEGGGGRGEGTAKGKVKEERER